MSIVHRIYCRKSSPGEGRQALSLPIQRADIDALLDRDPTLLTDKAFEESRSAKVPGRPLFNEMMADIEAGRIQGIVAWHPDRLSRNSTDGARIMTAIVEGKLVSLKFYAYNFENTPEGRYMLGMMLVNATYYSDNLSHRVKKAVEKKISDGWRPGLPPLGWLNDKNTRTIVPDIERFELISDLLQTFLEGSTSARRLWRVAVQRGLRTRHHAKLGGKPITLAGMHRILRDPFYAGLLVHNGRVFPGKHRPMITLREYDRIQELLRRPSSGRAKHRDLPFRGLVNCACNAAVTIEEKINKYGKTYIYLHCAARGRGECKERSIELKQMLMQAEALIARVHISEEAHAWGMKHIDRKGTTNRQALTTRLASVDEAIVAAKRETNNLVGMRLRDLMPDAEYLERRRYVDERRLRLEEERQSIKSDPDWTVHARTFLNFSNRAVELFKNADFDSKSTILRMVGSNFCLGDKRLSYVALKPFRPHEERAPCLTLRATLDDVRTLVQSKDPAFMDILAKMEDMLNSENGSAKAA